MVLCRANLLRCLLGPAGVLVLAGAACSEPPPAVSAPSAPSALAASEPGPYELGREPLTVTLRIPEERRKRLTDLAGGSQEGRLRLLVEGIEILRPGGVYEVHLEAPEGRLPGSASPSFAGHVAIFGKTGETPASTRTFDVTERIRSLLRERSSASPIESFRVTFLPGEARDGEASGPATGPVLRFRRVALVERPPAAP